MNVSEIDCIKADGNYMELHHRGGTSLLRGTLSHLESRLDPEMFLRTHRSVLVRVDAIREIQPTFTRAYTVFMKDGARLPVSRRYARNLPAVADSIKREGVKRFLRIPLDEPWRVGEAILMLLCEECEITHSGAVAHAMSKMWRRSARICS